MAYILNWRRQKADQRDWCFTAPLDFLLPPWIDQRAKSPYGGCPEIFDQLQIGSCTANAGVSSFKQVMIKEKVTAVNLSRLYLYYKERVIDGGDVSQDNGATIRDIMKAGATGVCREDIWPYGDGSSFAGPPSAEANANAPLHKIKSYLACADLTAMLQSLALGFPVCFGIDVYGSFMSAANGVIPMPGHHETLEGGHALKAVGYRLDVQRVIFANSWSQGWGERGYGTIPFAYLSSSMAGDFWSPRLF